MKRVKQRGQNHTGKSCWETMSYSDNPVTATRPGTVKEEIFTDLLVYKTTFMLAVAAGGNRCHYHHFQNEQILENTISDNLFIPVTSPI